FKGVIDQRQEGSLKEETKRRKGSHHVRLKSHIEACEEQSREDQVREMKTKKVSCQQGRSVTSQIKERIQDPNNKPRRSKKLVERRS
ncbi:unnamed protein product, partial [Cochlearia groenlandica]